MGEATSSSGMPGWQGRNSRVFVSCGAESLGMGQLSVRSSELQEDQGYAGPPGEPDTVSVPSRNTASRTHWGNGKGSQSVGGPTPGSSYLRSPSKSPGRDATGPPPLERLDTWTAKTTAGPGPAVPVCQRLCHGISPSLHKAPVTHVTCVWFTEEKAVAERGRELTRSHQLEAVEQGCKPRLSDVKAAFLAITQYTRISYQGVRLQACPASEQGRP